METIVWVVHVIAALVIIGLVLLQHGKGADMGAAFGSGTSGSLFGVSGSANLLSRATAAMVVVFFSTSLTLGYFSAQGSKSSSVVQSLQDSTEVQTESKAAPSGAKDIPQ